MGRDGDFSFKDDGVYMCLYIWQGFCEKLGKMGPAAMAISFRQAWLRRTVWEVAEFNWVYGLWYNELVFMGI